MSRTTEQVDLAITSDKHVLTAKDDKAGVEFVAKGRFGPYFLWPEDFHPPCLQTIKRRLTRRSHRRRAWWTSCCGVFQ